MNLELGTNWHVETELKARLRKLRGLTGMTHPQIVRRSQSAIRREELVKLENGRSKANSHRIRKGLAKGYGVSEELMNRFIDGDATPEEVASQVPPLSDAELNPPPESEVDVSAAPGSRLGSLGSWEKLLKAAQAKEPSFSPVVWERVAKMTVPEDMPVTVEWVVSMGQAVEKHLKSMKDMRDQKRPVRELRQSNTATIKKPIRN
jgi:transcriptional regulator with XRE-family HTH domain